MALIQDQVDGLIKAFESALRTHTRTALTLLLLQLFTFKHSNNADSSFRYLKSKATNKTEGGH